MRNQRSVLLLEGSVASCREMSFSLLVLERYFGGVFL